MEDELEDLYGEGPAIEATLDDQNPGLKTSETEVDPPSTIATGLQLPGITQLQESEIASHESATSPPSLIRLPEQTPSTEHATWHRHPDTPTLFHTAAADSKSHVYQNPEGANLPNIEMSVTSSCSVAVPGKPLERNDNYSDISRHISGGISKQTVSAEHSCGVDPARSTQAEWITDSSPYESSSEDSSDSSSDSDNYELLDPQEQARRLMENEDHSDDEGPPKSGKGVGARSQNEKLEEPIELPDIVLSLDTKIEELGKVETIIDNIGLVKAKTSGEYQVLESRSLLCLSDRTVIGVISETLGRVTEPLYSVRLRNQTEIDANAISSGTVIYYVPQHSTFVFTKALQGLKGSDASNIYDEEVADDEIEFSDDEAEADYKRGLKHERQARRQNNHGRKAATNAASKDGHPIENSSNIDRDHEVQDELYTPLSRPANFHEMMYQGHQPVNSSLRGHRGNRGRGSRGHHRGIANRGQGQLRAGNHRMPDYPPFPNPGQQSWFGGTQQNHVGPGYGHLFESQGTYQYPTPPAVASHLNPRHSGFHAQPQSHAAPNPPYLWPVQDNNPNQNAPHPPSALNPAHGSLATYGSANGVAINPMFLQSNPNFHNGPR